MRKTVLIVALALTPASFAHAQIPTAERDALIALYNATNGAGWTNNTGWDTAILGTECTWYGITCNLGWGQVTNISLSNNNLIGTIPSELGDLEKLFYLFLDRNQLTGSIPSQLGNLSSLVNLHLHDNQLSGSIPPELGNTNLAYTLSLGSNQLSGSIPPELGNLPAGLDNMFLQNNQLSGSIPPELGDLTGLKYLDLSGNQLSGNIPIELGSLVYLERLYLNTNQLSGSIPSELGDLVALGFLFLNSNQLSGDIPTELSNLTALNSWYLDIRWNALHSDNATLITFLDGKQWYGDWQSTQTIAPVNLTIDRIGDHTVWLTWDAVSYQIDRGGYSVCSAPTSSGAWTCDGWTEEKTDTTYPVTGLDPATTYDLAVVSYTDPHVDNQNVVNSDFSSLEMATTDSSGCAQPETEIMWGSPITLAVSGSYDSYLWITGEATSTIDITPLYDQWYWVTVTSAGPCEETALTWVDPTTVFVNGFESGDTTRWSSTVP
jgi:hypothetical protein